jgi:hypothetical protein
VTIVLDRIDFDPPIEKPHTFIKALTSQTVERLGYLVGPAMAHQIFALMKELKQDGILIRPSTPTRPDRNAAG